MGGKKLIKTKREFVISFLSVLVLLGVWTFGIMQSDKTKVFAATTPKYTVALTGTVTTGTWGGSRTTEVTDQTKIPVQKYSTSGKTEDIILYLTGTSTSGTDILHNNNYINTSQLNFSAALSDDTLILTTAEGVEVGRGTGSLSKTVSDGKYIIKLSHSKSSGAGYTQWRISVNVS